MYLTIPNTQIQQIPIPITYPLPQINKKRQDLIHQKYLFATKK